MVFQSSRRKNVVIKRKKIAIKADLSDVQNTGLQSAHNLQILVINSSREMAKEITMQISLSMPGASLMYSPTIELAALILKRRTVDLIVSSAVLPDGGVKKLEPLLSALENRPDVVVVDSANHRTLQLSKGSCYAVRERRHIALPTDEKDSIADLGADLRNDLNNPLQAIVAMVYVAKSESQISGSTKQALSAIETAAQNMAKVVNHLEDKIRKAIR